MILPVGYQCIDEKYTTTYDHIDKNILNDKFFVKNLFDGSIVSNIFYPIIYEKINNKDNINYYRSLDFYHMRMPINDLSVDIKTIYFVGLRDLTYSINNLKANICIDDIIPSTAMDDYDVIIENIRISPFPSKSNCIIQWLNIKDKLPSLLENYYILNNDLVMCFVNIYDLSYRNFENIIDLEPYLRDMIFSNDHTTLEILDTDVYKFNIDRSFLQLINISKLNFMTTPLNSNDRGGKRMIFQSEKLAFTLKSIIEKIMPSELTINFSFVNNVFRYNHFAPSDHKFVSHYDTPYINAKKRLISKYTLIIYLTGENEPDNYPLTINNKECSIKELDVYLFSQKMEHEGKSYVSRDKIFLRTELVYYDDNLVENYEIAQLFNRSCYYIKQSIYNPIIKKYINDMFNTVTKMRYNLTCEKVVYPSFLKKIDKTEYITNGHYYWAKLNDLNSVKEFTTVILLDYFGQITGKMIEIDEFDNDTIFSLLKKTDTKDIFDSLPNAFFNDIPNGKAYINKYFDTIKKSEGYRYSCGSCDGEKDGMHYADPCTSQILESIVKDTNSTCDKYSLILSGEQIYINKNDIRVNNGIIYFENTGLHNEIIFASCMGHNVGFDINVDMVETKKYALPPIYFNEIGNSCYKFSIDVFNNGVSYGYLKIPSIIVNSKYEDFNEIVNINYRFDNLLASDYQTNNVLVDAYISILIHNVNILLSAYEYIVGGYNIYAEYKIADISEIAIQIINSLRNKSSRKNSLVPFKYIFSTNDAKNIGVPELCSYIEKRKKYCQEIFDQKNTITKKNIIFYLGLVCDYLLYYNTVINDNMKKKKCVQLMRNYKLSFYLLDKIHGYHNQ